MQVKITRWGNSQGIRLSKKILDSVGITDPIGQKLEVNVDQDKIIIKKAPTKSKLAERFNGFDLDSYRKANQDSKEFDWGESVGKELL